MLTLVLLAGCARDRPPTTNLQRIQEATVILFTDVVETDDGRGYECTINEIWRDQSGGRFTQRVGDRLQREPGKTMQEKKPNVRSGEHTVECFQVLNGNLMFTGSYHIHDGSLEFLGARINVSEFKQKYVL